MFEFLKNVMRDGEEFPEHPNVRFPVSGADVKNAEYRVGVQFPNQLRAFFSEIGCGFLKASQTDSARTEFNYINRFLDPNEVAELYLGVNEDLSPSEGFDDGELPFFEIGDQLYLVVRRDGDNDNQVCWPLGEVICDDLVTFVSKLVHDPRFYHKSVLD